MTGKLQTARPRVLREMNDAQKVRVGDSNADQSETTLDDTFTCLRRRYYMPLRCFEFEMTGCWSWLGAIMFDMWLTSIFYLRSQYQLSCLPSCYLELLSTYTLLCKIYYDTLSIFLLCFAAPYFFFLLKESRKPNTSLSKSVASKT